MNYISRIAAILFLSVFLMPRALHAQADAILVDKAGRVGMGTSEPKFRLTLAGRDSVFAVDNDAIFYAKNATGIYEPFLWPRWNNNYTYFNYGLSGFIIRDDSNRAAMSISDDRNVAMENNLTVKKDGTMRNLYLNGTHTIYSSLHGVIDWGNNNQGNLYFRSLKTQGNPGEYADVMSISGTGDLTATGKVSAASVTANSIETAMPKGNIARRDWRPYGTPTFCWRGTELESMPEFSIFSAKGRATIDWYDSRKPYGNKRMFKIIGLSQEAQSNNSAPDNGIYITLPATAGCPNSLLISTIDFNRWSVFSVWLVKADGSVPVKISRSANNANGGNNGAFTYTVGPQGQFKEVASHAWLSFTVSEQQVASYMSNNKLRFLITSGPGNSDGAALHLSGIAIVPNRYGFCQQPALAAHFGLNGDYFNQIEWYGMYGTEGLARVPAGTMSTVYVKVVDPSKDMVVTFHEIADGNFRGNVSVTVGSDINTNYYPSQGIDCIASHLYKGIMSMRPASIIIPAAVVTSAMRTTNSGINAIKLTLFNPGNDPYFIFGIDSEFY